MADNVTPQAGKDGATPPASDASTQTPAPAPAPADSILDGAGKKPEGSAAPEPNKDAGKEGQPPADKPKADDKKPDVAPEQYADFKLPEGMTLDKPAIDSFKGLAKELGLTQEKAQKLVDLQAGMVKAQTVAQKAEVDATVKQWQEQFKKDAGANLEQEMGSIGKFKSQILDADTVKFLNDTGLANHPGLMKAFAKAGRLLAEDNPPAGNKPVGSSDVAKMLFPSMNK